MTDWIMLFFKRKKKPMWIAFRTTTDHNWSRDEYITFDTQSEALEQYHQWLKACETYCAGYAPIAGATEPHWVDQS